MALDLSALIGEGGGGGNLNFDLAATSPSGDSIFKKPFGSTTAFRTEQGGLVKATFMFDPNLPWQPSHALASITTDYMAEMKLQLTKLLLDPEDIAPRKFSLEETIWSNIKQNMHSTILSKCVFSDPNNLKEYMDIIKVNVTKSYHEEEQLTQAMTTQEYKFTFQIAIDAYPQSINSRLPEGKQSPNEKTGVLMFKIEGLPHDTKMDDTPATPANADAASTDGDAMADGDDAAGTPRGRTREGGSTKRARSKSRTRNQKERQHLKKLQKDLGMTPDEIDQGDVYWEKQFPLTASEFFDQFSSWFSTCISTVQQLLNKQQKNSLYQ